MSSDAKKHSKLSRDGFRENFQEDFREGFQENFQEDPKEDYKEELKEELSQKEFFELIKSNFPKLDAADISRAAEQLIEFGRDELEIILHPGKFITKKGKRVQAAYIRTAPLVYKLTKLTTEEAEQKDRTAQKENTEQTDQDFRKWLSIASKASELSFSCFEGFFGSSVVILKKKGVKGLPLLEMWTEIGISLAEKSNRLAIAYFNHTASIATSANLTSNISNNISNNISTDTPTYTDTTTPIHTGATTCTDTSADTFTYTSTDIRDLESFKEIISIGEKFASSNAKVAEAYFEYLQDMLVLFSPEDLQLFYSIIDRLLDVQWTIAVDILAASKDVFSAIPPRRQKELLTALYEFTGCLNSCPDRTDSAALTLALFKNTPAALARLDNRSFETWASIAKEIAKINVDAAVSFLTRSPGVLGFLKISELQKWAEKGIVSLSSEKQAFESFYESSFRSLEKHLKTINIEERELLLDIGTKIALINPGCTGSYFEYSPAALRLLSGSEFKSWVDVGVRVSKESSSLGSNYFKNSVTSFRKIPPSYHGEILEIAGALLEKDWLLAGKFFENLPDVVEKIEHRNISKWANIGTKVYDADKNLAVDYFTYSPVLLTELDVFELEEWALKGLEIFKDNTSLGRPYFSLKSRSSKDFIDELTGSADLKKIANILRYYAMGLSGASFKVRSKKELPDYNETNETEPVNPVISGRTIYLEPKIKKYGNFQDNFKVYKLSIMHEVGHAQFSSSKIPLEGVCELLTAINEKYGAERNHRLSEDIRFSRDTIGISTIIAMFPNRVLAASILGILEDARVEYLITDLYRGVRPDLELIRYQMLLARPVPEGELEKLIEALLWLSTLHEPPFELPLFGFTEENKPILDNIRATLRNRILRPDSSTLTSLEATFSIYCMLEDLLGPLENRKYEVLKNIEYRGMGLSSFRAKGSLTPDNHASVIKSFIPESEDCSGAENQRAEKEKPEKKELEKKPMYATDKNWKVLGSYRYDEWDYVMNDYKSDWCAVHEIEPAGGSGEYYTDASDRYRNEIALIKNVFSRMKPESFHRLKGQTDGTEIDIDAFSEALIERRCGINPDEKLYVRRDKRKRDVATLFLVDVSASTRKRLRGEGRNVEERRSIGRRSSIIDIEKDALVIMVQALENIGDKYAIYAFSGHTKEDVEYYIVKEFGEELSASVEQRISLLEPVANTRLGPAIRHSIKKLEQVNARTKILVLLSDGEPYDTCYGEGAYQGKLAEEDTKVAILEGNSRGVHFFCITVDNSPGDYLDNIFSDFEYTIIDDAQILPERLPLLYKRITT